MTSNASGLICLFPRLDPFPTFCPPTLGTQRSFTLNEDLHRESPDAIQLSWRGVRFQVRPLLVPGAADPLQRKEVSFFYEGNFS